MPSFASLRLSRAPSPERWWIPAAHRSRKAKVTATNQATGAIAVAETTEEGYYKLPYLPAGKYKLAVEKDGFVINRVTDVPVLVGQIATINVTLKPGSVHDEVTVTSNAVMVDQVSSSLGYVTGATQILELPTGRSPYSLMNLSPGVIATGNSGTGPIISGGRSNTIGDPASMARTPATTRLSTTPTRLRRKTVQEVRFITNSFSAEYGRSAGGVLVAAGKIGANQVHGSVYDYLKNDKLNANSWANNRNNVLRGRQRHNEYGFSASGPVYLPKVYDGRNKTFFFFNWEQINDHGVSTPTANVPTALQKSGDFSQTFTSAGCVDPDLRSADHGRRPDAEERFQPLAIPRQCGPAKPHGSDHEEDHRLSIPILRWRSPPPCRPTGRRISP